MSRHLVSTQAVEAECRDCRGAVIRAVAEGQPVQVDAAPITAGEEIGALIEGRMTFAYFRTGELVHRHAGRIRVGLVGESVHAEHRCTTYTQPSLIGAA